MALKTALTEDQIYRRLQELSGDIARKQVEFDELKSILRAQQLGEHGPITVYAVRETKVRGYRRRAFRAVRVNR